MFQPKFIQIPYGVLIDEDLRHVDRLAYGVIYLLSRNEFASCNCSNETIGRMINVSGRTIQDCLTRLEKSGHIERTFKDKNRKSRDRIYPKVVRTNDGTSTHKRVY